jgi:hypothetical protein
MAGPHCVSQNYSGTQEPLDGCRSSSLARVTQTRQLVREIPAARQGREE